jgi:hypothetical protein
VRPIGQGKRQGTKRARGIGAALSQVDQEGGEEASEVLAILSLEPRWVTEAEADDFPIVHGNGQALHDRAAALAGEDGITVNILLLSSCPASGAGDNPEALASTTDRSASITVAGHTRYTSLAEQSSIHAGSRGGCSIAMKGAMTASVRASRNRAHS